MQAYGADPAIVYRRMTTEAEFGPGVEPVSTALVEAVLKGPHAYSDWSEPRDYEIDFDPGMLLFCGKTFGIWGLGQNSRDFCLADAICDHLSEGERKKFVDPSRSLSQEERRDIQRHGYSFSDFQCSLWSEEMSGLDSTDTLIRLQVPVAAIWIAHHQGGSLLTWVIANPPLKPCGFGKIMDPYTCYQEIAMFIGNQLNALDAAPLRTGDDRTIAQQKGFDDQSFRREPGLKDERRKANRQRKKGG